MKKFLCPYCLTEHPLYECMCGDCGMRSYVTRDYEKRKYDYSSIPSCFFERADNVYIPVVGSRMAGKSVYVGTLVNNLISPNFKLAHESYKYYWDTFYEPLYKGHAVCNADEPCTSVPLMFEVNSILQENYCYKSVLRYGMALYDVQGQVLLEEECFKYRTEYQRLIEYASGIIFMIDPLQMDGIRKDLSGKITLPYQNCKDMLSMLYRMKEIVGTNRKLPPIAFVLSKIDILEKHRIVPDDWIVLQKSTYSDMGEISCQDVIQSEIESFFRQYMPTHIWREIDEIQDKSFFGVSSLGFNPTGGKLTQTISPLRVLDPIVWILGKNKKFPQGWIEE